MKTYTIQHSKYGKSPHTGANKQGLSDMAEARKYLYSSIVDVGEDFLWDRVFRFSLPKSAEKVKIVYVEPRKGIRGYWRFTLSYLIDEDDLRRAAREGKSNED